MPKKMSVLLVLGDNLRRLRLKEGLTQQSLSVRVGLSRNCISNIERGVENPSYHSLRGLANVLGCSMFEVCKGRFRITGSDVRDLRKRLGLTPMVFGDLVGVRSVTVLNWEKTKGEIGIKSQGTMARLQGLKGKGKREVAEMLPKEAKEPKAKAKAKAKKS